MSLYGSLDKTKHFSEFGSPLVTAAGVKTPAQRKALALAALGLTATAAEINALASTGLDATELGFLNGALAGAPIASKAVVANSDRSVATIRSIIEDGAAVVLTAAQCGALCVFDKVDGALFTLPTPVVGLWYDFLCDVASTSVGQKIITSAGTIFIQGTVPHLKTDNTFTYNAANGTTHVSVNFDGTTKGGLPGTRVRLTCRSATKWMIEGLTLASGTVATPFATS